MSVVETSGFQSVNDPKAGLRWGGSFATVLALHVGVAVVVATWAIPMIAPEAPPPAVMIDMLPAPTPPAPVKPIEPEPEVKPKEIPVIEKAAVVIHKPKPKPKPKVEEKKKPEPVKTETVRQAPVAPAPSATPVEARPAPSPNYLSLIYSHLERHKRYPSSAQRRHQTGTVYLQFTIDKSGHVLSARIDKSSGIASLDEEVAKMIHRADPLPPLPADMHQNSLSLVVPVVFNLKN